jgi:hypothetical protein
VTGEVDAGTCGAQWVQGDVANGGEVLFACGLPASSGASCAAYCGDPSFVCQVVCNNGVPAPLAQEPWLDTDAGANPVVVSCYRAQLGRRPAGLVAPSELDARSVGELLAHHAYLEAAAVDAFLDLAEQLESHGAPRELVRRLRKAASEEVRHARVTGALARARGGAPREVIVAPAGKRSLLAIALENAGEGCVRETWAAALAVAQGERAEDPEVREAMQGIARDELAHAVLSWDVAAWLEAQLSLEERAAVAAATVKALAEVEEEVEQTVPAQWRNALGLPSREEARAILAKMRADVWGAELAA